MKKILSKLLIIALMLSFLFGICVTTPTYAADPVDGTTALTGNVIDCHNYEGIDGGGVICVAKLVLNIMTYGIGILGVVGIVISGIQYITSQGDPGKMAKAKNRIIQVVIGLVIYAVLYAALYFLVPGFNTDILNGNGSSSSGSGSSDPRDESSSIIYKASEIMGNLTSNGDGNYVLKYKIGDNTDSSVTINSNSDVNCVNGSILVIRPVKRGYDERKINMKSDSECTNALSQLKQEVDF